MSIPRLVKNTNTGIYEVRFSDHGRSRVRSLHLKDEQEAMKAFATVHFEKAGVDMKQVEFFIHPTNDAWCRDHGPAFLLNNKTNEKHKAKGLQSRARANRNVLENRMGSA